MGIVCAATVLGVGSLLVTGDDVSPPLEARNSVSPRDTFTESQLGEQVARLVGDAQRAGGSRLPSGIGVQSETSSEQQVFVQPTLPECVLRAIRPGASVLAAEEGVYRGESALLVVVSEAEDAGHVVASIVEAGCPEGSASSVADVLLTRSLPRP